MLGITSPFIQQLSSCAHILEAEFLPLLLFNKAVTSQQQSSCAIPTCRPRGGGSGAQAGQQRAVLRCGEETRRSHSTTSSLAPPLPCMAELTHTRRGVGASENLGGHVVHGIYRELEIASYCYQYQRRQ